MGFLCAMRRVEMRWRRITHKQKQQKKSQVVNNETARTVDAWQKRLDDDERRKQKEMQVTEKYIRRHFGHGCSVELLLEDGVVEEGQQKRKQEFVRVAKKLEKIDAALRKEANGEVEGGGVVRSANGFAKRKIKTE